MEDNISGGSTRPAPQRNLRAPSRWGIRLRGLAVLLIAVVVVVTGWRMAEPDHDGEVGFGIVAANLGDGVSTSTPVRLRGLAVGSVVAIEPQSATRQLIRVSVDEPRLAELSSTMQVRFVSANVFGSTAVELIPQQGGDPITSSSVIDVGTDIDDFTVTRVLRDSSRAILDVVTKKFELSLDSAASLGTDLTPMLSSALVTMRSLAKTQSMSLRDFTAAVADTSEGLAPFTPSALRILTSLASVEKLDDPVATQQASDTIEEVSNLVFSFAGKLVGALEPMSAAVDMLLDLVIPLNQGMRNVTAADVTSLLKGVDGAFDRKGDRVTLNTEVLVDMPAFRIPLQLTGGQR